MTRVKYTGITAAAIVLVIIAAAAAIAFAPRGELILSDAATGEVRARLPLPEGKFSVTFIHSVNRSPYTDCYEVADGKIYAVAARFHSFGAGVESWPGKGARLESDGGSMLATGEPFETPELTYIVGTVSDHVLEVGGESYSLTELCGRNAAVRFEYR